MTVLFIAIGNLYRRDDGVAHKVLELLRAPSALVTTRSLLQLTPEVAEDLARFDRVIFIDADVEPGEPSLTLVEANAQTRSRLGHAMGPEEVVLSQGRCTASMAKRGCAASPAATSAKEPA